MLDEAASFQSGWMVMVMVLGEAGVQDTSILAFACM
jgi:hypothetical protein